MAIIAKTKIVIAEKPVSMGILVEDQSMTITWSGKTGIASSNIIYDDPTVDVTVVMKGYIGQSYKLTLTLNKVDKVIEGELEEDGKTLVSSSTPLSYFGLALAEEDCFIPNHENVRISIIRLNDQQ